MGGSLAPRRPSPAKIGDWFRGLPGWLRPWFVAPGAAVGRCCSRSRPRGAGQCRGAGAEEVIPDVAPTVALGGARDADRPVRLELASGSGGLLRGPAGRGPPRQPSGRAAEGRPGCRARTHPPPWRDRCPAVGRSGPSPGGPGGGRFGAAVAGGDTRLRRCGPRDDRAQPGRRPRRRGGPRCQHRQLGQTLPACEQVPQPRVPVRQAAQVAMPPQGLGHPCPVGSYGGHLDHAPGATAPASTAGFTAGWARSRTGGRGRAGR
jgi:hypothetical protein